LLKEQPAYSLLKDGWPALAEEIESAHAALAEAGKRAVLMVSVGERLDQSDFAMWDARDGNGNLYREYKGAVPVLVVPLEEDSQR
jgi:hypothetical protein